MTDAKTRQSSGNNEARIPTEAELDASFDAHSNWGRWGDDDQRGMLNHQAHSRTRVSREVAELFCSRWGRFECRAVPAVRLIRSQCSTGVTF